MKKIILSILITLFIIPALFAQNSSEYHKNEFYGGFSHLRMVDRTDIEDDENQNPNINGFNAAYTRNIHQFIGIKVQVSGHYGRFSVETGNPYFVTRNVHTVTGGVQFKNNSKAGKVKPFAHALIGYGTSGNYAQTNSGTTGEIIHSSKRRDNYWAGVFGGGLDLKVSDRFSLRVIQIDYVKANPSPGYNSGNFQIGAGIVIH